MINVKKKLKSDFSKHHINHFYAMFIGRQKKGGGSIVCSIVYTLNSTSYKVVERAKKPSSIKYKIILKIVKVFTN